MVGRQRTLAGLQDGVRFFGGRNCRAATHVGDAFVDGPLEARHATANGVLAQPNLLHGFDFDVQEVVLAVGVEIGVIDARGDARQKELCGGQARRSVHGFAVEFLPQRIHAAQPVQGAALLTGRHDPCQRLAVVVMQVDETGQHKMVASVDLPRRRRALIRFRPETGDNIVLDGNPGVGERRLVGCLAEIKARRVPYQESRLRHFLIHA